MNTLLNIFRIGFWSIFIIDLTFQLHLKGFIGKVTLFLMCVFFIGWTFLEIYLYFRKKRRFKMR